MDRTALLPLLLLLLAPGAARAQPRLPPPTLKGVLSESLVAKARVRWSKAVAEGRIEVGIGGGWAERRNPRWSPDPARLRYDLDRNRELERAIKQARLGAQAPVSADPAQRTLELLARGQDGWVVVGSWSMKEAQWRKRYPALHRLLEPLFEAPAEAFVPTRSMPTPR